MKLKYYLRGLGVGIICTAIIMGIALSGNKKEKLTDTEIIERARLLGMVMAEDGSEEGEEASAEPEGKDAESQEGNGTKSPDAKGQEDSAKGQEAGSQKGADAEEKDAKGQDSKDSEGTDAKGQDSKDSEGTDEKGQDSKGSEGADAKGQDSGTKEGASASKPEENKASGNDGQNPTSPEGMVEFEISARDHSEDVSRKLFEAGLIKDASSFNQYMTENKMDEHLQTGKYQIPAGATEDEILDMIVRLP